MQYEAPLGCPSRATFLAGLSRLLPGLEFPEGNDRTKRPRAGVESVSSAEPQLSIAFEERAGQYHARMSHGETKRDVAAPVCSDAAYALAVITAIELDPTASTESTVRAEDFIEPAPSSLPAATSGDSSVAPPANRVPGRSESLTSQPPKQGASKQEASRHWMLLAGPRLGSGDVGAWGVGGEVTLFTAGQNPWSNFAIAARGSTTTKDVSLTDVSFTRVGMALSWCPGDITSAGTQFALCLGAEGGWALASTSPDPSLATSRRVGRFNAVAIADLVLGYAIGGGWTLAFRPGLEVILVRNEYVIENAVGSTVAEVRHAPVTGFGLLQVGHAL